MSPTAPSLRSRLLLWTGLALTWWALIFIGTHLPGTLVGGFSSLDKVQHAGAFFGLAVLLCAAYEAWRPRREWGYLIVFLLTISYGAIDEWSQSFVPYRSSDVCDWLADAGGAALGVGLMFFFAACCRSRSAATAAALAADASSDVSTR